MQAGLHRTALLVAGSVRPWQFSSLLAPASTRTGLLAVPSVLGQILHQSLHPMSALRLPAPLSPQQLSNRPTPRSRQQPLGSRDDARSSLQHLTIQPARTDASRAPNQPAISPPQHRRHQARRAVSQNPVPARAVVPAHFPGSASSTSAGGR